MPAAARDLANYDSASTTRFLRRTTVLFVPTANPDGRAADTRENSNDFDVNRDHLVLETEEGRAMAEVFRDYAPDLVHDLHEFGEDPEVYDRQLIHLWPRNRNVDEAAHDLSVDLNEDYVDPQVQDAGYTTGIYGIWTDDKESRSRRSPVTATSGSCATSRGCATPSGSWSRPTRTRPRQKRRPTSRPRTCAGWTASGMGKQPRLPAGEPGRGRREDRRRGRADDRVRRHGGLGPLVRRR